MEWTLKDSRTAIIALYRCGHSPTKIFKLLENLKFSLRFVYRTIERYSEVSSLNDKKRSGRPRTARTPAVVQAIRARIARNPARKQKVMALQMGLSKNTVKRVLNQDLRLRAYKRKTGHLLNGRLKALRFKRSKALLKKYAKNNHRCILFSDEKIFDIEENCNKQNDRVYARNSKEASNSIPRIQRGHHPSSVMVWLGVSYAGVTSMHFCEKGVKTSAKVYQDTVLTNIVKPLSHTMFLNQHWVYQQDSAPAHKAKSTQAWLASNKIDFIRHEDWPSSSPDLNPLDYKIWQYLEEKVCSKPHANLDSLKKSLATAVANIDMKVVRESIDDWPRRLQACVDNYGGHFE